MCEKSNGVVISNFFTTDKPVQYDKLNKNNNNKKTTTK